MPATATDKYPVSRKYKFEYGEDSILTIHHDPETPIEYTIYRDDDVIGECMRGSIWYCTGYIEQGGYAHGHLLIEKPLILEKARDTFLLFSHDSNGRVLRLGNRIERFEGVLCHYLFTYQNNDVFYDIWNEATGLHQVRQLGRPTSLFEHPTMPDFSWDRINKKLRIRYQKETFIPLEELILVPTTPI